MTRKKNDPPVHESAFGEPRDWDEVLDRLSSSVRSRNLEDSTLSEASSRVWKRITTELAEDSSAPSDSSSFSVLRECEDFRQLIDESIAKTLPAERRILFDSHIRECFPCRRALAEASKHGSLEAASLAKEESEHVSDEKDDRASLLLRLAVAAIVLIASSAGIFFMVSPQKTLGEIREADGTLLRLMGQDSVVLTSQDVIQDGEWIRTGKNSNASITLPDGSVIEIGARAELSLSQWLGDTTVHLRRGQVLIEASDQGTGHLFVKTDDCRVAVQGTVFSVNSGTLGSRVSVFEGRVEIEEGGSSSILLPGQQHSTSPSLEYVALEDEIAWSKHAEKWIALLETVSAIRKDLDRIEAQEPTTSTRLLDMVPPGTVVYISIPNVADNLTRAADVLLDRIRSNEALNRWWQENMRKTGTEQTLVAALDRVRLYGNLIGEEVVISMGGIGVGAGAPDFLLLADITDATALRQALSVELGMASVVAGGPAPVVFLDSRGRPEREAKEDETLFVWLHGDLLVASPDPARIRDTLARRKSDDNPFKRSGFHEKLATAYHRGKGWLVGADVRTAMHDILGESDTAGIQQQTSHAGGFEDIDYVLFERKTVRNKTENRVVVSFDKPREGMASWLAEPAPMGSLGFISPDAHVAAALVMKTPETMLQDIVSFFRQQSWLHDSTGFDPAVELAWIREFARPLGGEFAIALDGPILPTPSWKVVFEIYEQQAAQEAIVRLIDEINQWIATNSHRGNMISGLRLESADFRGRSAYALRIDGLPVSVYYLYADGYLVMTPSLALLERTMQNYENAYSLAASRTFTDLLPQGRDVNFSGILYQDMGSLLGPLSRFSSIAGKLSLEQRDFLAKLADEAPATLIYAHASASEIAVSTTGNGTFGMELGNLIGLTSAFGMNEILSDTMFLPSEGTVSDASSSVQESQ